MAEFPGVPFCSGVLIPSGNGIHDLLDDLRRISHIMFFSEKDEILELDRRSFPAHASRAEAGGEWIGGEREIKGRSQAWAC